MRILNIKNSNDGFIQHFYKFKCNIKNWFSVKNSAGFTLIELLLVMGISMSLFGIVVINSFRFQNTNSKQSNMDTLVSDIRAQQLKAMLGSTEGRSESDSFGIYFYTDSYVLFHGDTFNDSDPDNFTVDLPEDLEIENTTFPGNEIVFNQTSGEISGFNPGSDTVTIDSLNIDVQSEILFNRYGVIIGIN